MSNMSARKRKYSKIYEHESSIQEQAFDKIIADLTLKCRNFQLFYSKIAALPLQDPIDIALHEEIKSTLRGVLQFLSEEVLQNYHGPTLGVPSLQRLSANATINWWNYSSIFNRKLHTVLSREEQAYKDLLKQTILVCMRTWRIMFDIDRLDDFYTYIDHDYISGISSITDYGICAMVCEPKIRDFGNRLDTIRRIRHLHKLFRHLISIILQTRNNTPMSQFSDHDWRWINRVHPELMQEFIPFFNHLNSRGGDFTEGDLKNFFVNVAAPYVLSYATTHIEDIDTRNNVKRFATQLIRRGKFLDFIFYFLGFAELCLENEEKMRYCFSLLTDFGPDTQPLV